MTPEDRFADLIDEMLAADRAVSPPSPGGGFGSSALRYQNKIFAMLVRGRLVLKLPKARVDGLVESGDGDRFDANKGKPMKEWLALDPGSALGWSALAREAMTFVGSPQRTRQKS